MEHTITFTSEEFGTLINALIIAEAEEKKVSDIWSNMYKANGNDEDCKYWEDFHFKQYEAIDTLLQKLL